MAVFITEIPDFRFSGLYYPQIFQSLTIYRRSFMTELNDEDVNAPTTQILGAFAAGFHYCNVLLDHVALEAMFASCRLRNSLASHLLLIGQSLKEALPAVTDLLMKLGSPVAANTTIAEGTLFATIPTVEIDEILYEIVEDVPVTRTDLPTYAWEEDYDPLGSTFTDVIDAMNGFDPLDLWGGVPVAGDVLWIGHDSALYDHIRLYLSDKGDLFDDENDWVLEYYDGGTDDSVPSDATAVGPAMVFDLTTLLGTNDRSGTEVTVRLTTTGAEEVATSYFSAGTNYVDTGYLGQVVPSEVESDYVVGAAIKEVPSAVLVEQTDGFEISWDLPENQSRQWVKSTVNGVEAYWLRLRCVNDTTNSPVFNNGIDITLGTQWLKNEVVQGETWIDDPAGTFDGTLNQEFDTTQENVIDGSVRLFVDEGGGDLEYVRVDDFLSSNAASLHFTRSFDDDGKATVRVGDGQAGYLPPISATSKLQYRIGAEDDGNVGPGEITVIKSGPTYVAAVGNPRPAAGWAAPEGSTDDSIAEIKITAPAALRIMEKAVTASDMEELAQAYIFESGAKLVARALAIPNGFGDKTVKLLVVGQGGVHLSDDQLDELSLAFNGDSVAGIPGMIIAGLQLTAVNYIRKVIDVTTTVAGGGLETIETAIASYLLPTAQKSNGDWEHDFDDIVYRLGILVAAANSDPTIDTVVSMADPAGDTVLGQNELPFPGVITVTVI